MESNLVQNLVNLKSLPETWAVKDFKEVVSDNSGGNKKLAKSNFLKEGDIAVVDQGKNLIAGFYNDTSLAVKTQPPYVVFGDHTRAFKYVDFPFIMGADGTKVLQPKKGNCATKYLYYFFLSINVPNTGYNRHFKYLKSLKIPLPPLDQQKKIAAILDLADTCRQKTKALIEKYDELTQSLFLDMFGDPVRNPEGWEKVPFGNFITVLTDYHSNGSYETLAKHVTLKNEPDFSLMVRTTDLEKNNFVDGVKYIDEHAYNHLNKSKIYGGEIIINKIGSAGKVYRMPKLNRPVSLGMNAFLLRFNDSINQVFLYFQLTSKYGEREIQKRVKGAVTKTIRKDAVREIPILSPPLKLQNQFAERVQTIEAQKAQAQGSLDQAEDLFNSLLQKAFKGELV